MENPDLERDLLACSWLKEKVLASDVYAQRLYAAMCNNLFQKQEVMSVLSDQTWSCTWRYAGGIVANLRDQGDYLDWYCSGRLGNPDNHGHTPGEYVGEGYVDAEIRQDLLELGWIVVDYDWDDYD